jgi:hypothetical protein
MSASALELISYNVHFQATPRFLNKGFIPQTLEPPPYQGRGVA